MKKLFVSTLLITVLVSCGDRHKTVNNSIEKTGLDSSKRSVIAKKVELPIQKNNLIIDKIIGIWRSAEDENQNASFDIRKNEIYYPELFKSYKYNIFQDSMKIDFDDYKGNYLIKMRGEDTLVLIGDEEQIYYRIKK